MAMEPAAQSPSSLGFRMPAEWEPHDATWLSWPHNEDTWPDGLEPVERALAAAAHAIAQGEQLYVNVLGEEHEEHVRSLLAATGALRRTRFFHVPTNDAWVRDHGPLFLTRQGPRPELAATSWGFNSWGGKYPPWDDDDAASTRMAGALGVRTFERDMVLEGGSIDVNGQDMLLTTRSCLLNPNRNPRLDADAIERRLKEDLGVDHVIWLDDGIAGDDTDGHVDDVTRFVAPRTVVTVVEDDPSDSNFEPLRDNLVRLRGLRMRDGSPLEVIPLPLPRPIWIRGDRMPASYANFYIANRVVVVPTFSDPADRQALDALQRVFSDREVIAMDCRDLIYGLGAIHCLTQQVPSTPAATR